MTRKMRTLMISMVGVFLIVSFAVALTVKTISKAENPFTKSQVMAMNVEDIAGVWTDNSVKTGDASGNMAKKASLTDNTHIGSIKVGKETAISFKLDLRANLEYRISLRHSGNQILNEGDLIFVLMCKSDGEVQVQINRYNAEAPAFYRDGTATPAITMWVDANNINQNFQMSINDNDDGGSRISFKAMVEGKLTNHYVDIPKANSKNGEYVSFFAKSVGIETVATVKSMTDNAIIAPALPVFNDIKSNIAAGTTTNQFLGKHNVGKNAEMNFKINTSTTKASQYRVTLRHSGANTLADGDLIMVVDSWGDGNVFLQINRYNAEACMFTDDSGMTPVNKINIDGGINPIKFSITDNEGGGCRINVTANVSGVAKHFYFDVIAANEKVGTHMAVFAQNASNTALEMGATDITITGATAKPFNPIAFANSNTIVVGEKINLNAVSKTDAQLENVTYTVKTQGTGFTANINASGELSTTALSSDLGKTFVITATSGTVSKDLTMTIAYVVSFEPKSLVFIGESIELKMFSLSTEIPNTDVVYAITEGADFAEIKDGKLLGKKIGSVKISATTAGVTKTSVININNPLEIVVENNKVGLGKTSKLSYSINSLSCLTGSAVYEITSGTEFAEITGGKLKGLKSGIITLQVTLQSADYGNIVATKKINVVAETYNSLMLDSANVYHEVGVVTNEYSGKGMIFEFDLLDFVHSSFSSEMVFIVGADGNDVTSMFDGGAISKFSNVSALSFYVPDPAVRSENVVLRYWPNVSEIVGGRDNIPVFKSYDANGVATVHKEGSYDIPVPASDDLSINRTYRIEFNFDGSLVVKSKVIGAENYTLLAETETGSKWVADTAPDSAFKNVYSGIIMRRQTNQSVSANIDNLTMTLPSQGDGDAQVIGSFANGESDGLDYSFDGYPTANYVSGRVNKLYVRADNFGEEVEIGSEVKLSYFIPDARNMDVSYQIISGGELCTLTGDLLKVNKSGTIKVKAGSGDYESSVMDIVVAAGEEVKADTSGCGGCGAVITNLTTGGTIGAIMLVMGGILVLILVIRRKKNNI